MTDSQGFVSVASTEPLQERTATPVQQQQQGVAGQVVELFQRSSHPTAALFHVLFKILALIFYFFSSFFTNSFVIIFVVCVVLMAFDFWTVKNITGRKMVGLRWWNDVSEDGTSSYRYESIDDPSQITRPDYVIFWYSLYLTALLWAIFSFFALLKFDFWSLTICAIALGLIYTNVIGFWNCSSERARVEQTVNAAIQQGTVAAISSNWFAKASGLAPKTADVV